MGRHSVGKIGKEKEEQRKGGDTLGRKDPKSIFLIETGYWRTVFVFVLKLWKLYKKPSRY